MDEEKTRDTKLFVTELEEEKWIQGYPLITDYGFIKALKVYQSLEYRDEIDFIKQQGWEIVNMLKNIYSETDFVHETMLKDLENNELIVCIRLNLFGLKDNYLRVFSMFIDNFEEISFWKMTQTEFDNLRKLILKFNKIHLYEANPNSRIERYNRINSYIAFKKSRMLEFDTMFSALMIGIGGGKTPDEINNLTLRQFNSAYDRITLVKGYETTTLYKTVDSKDSVKIVDWDASFRAVKGDEEKEYNSIEELKKTNPLANGK